MTSQIPSLNLHYGMPNCPSCKKEGLVLIDKEHVACLHCDYKRDFSKSIATPPKNDYSTVWFIFWLIFGLVLFLLVSSVG